MEKNIIRKIKEAVIEVGNLVLNANYDDLEIKNKAGNNNIATNYDILVQKKLKQSLLELIPSAIFTGEEGNTINYSDSEYRFIVDPIDGTTNFSRNLKLSAISVALLKEETPIVGICYNPYTKELFEAEKGKGAFLNGKRIYVSDKKLKNGIVFCGCAPYYDNLRKRSLDIQRKFALVASDFRRFGSSVIELCNIACGRAELFFELKLMPWDYAAASLIIQEAGGCIKTIDGEDIQYSKPTSIIATNNTEDYFKYIKGE
ncbi:MAG: inositol monophosphatase [Clostridia bacterium]|nr:inositol monophosphatase [Clostridia bacterium]